jgi:hypothetical protein
MTNVATPNDKSGSANTGSSNTGSANYLKKVFDQSLAILSEGAGSVQARRRSVPLRIDAVNLQKRALSDAANALASLWKISQPKSPKLHTGIVQYSR